MTYFFSDATHGSGFYKVMLTRTALPFLLLLLLRLEAPAFSGITAPLLTHFLMRTKENQYSPIALVCCQISLDTVFYLAFISV